MQDRAATDLFEPIFTERRPGSHQVGDDVCGARRWRRLQRAVSGDQREVCNPLVVEEVARQVGELRRYAQHSSRNMHGRGEIGEVPDRYHVEPVIRHRERQVTLGNPQLGVQHEQIGALVARLGNEVVAGDAQVRLAGLDHTYDVGHALKMHRDRGERGDGCAVVPGTNAPDGQPAVGEQPEDRLLQRPFAR